MSRKSRRSWRPALAAAFALFVSAPASAVAESFPPSKVEFDEPSITVCPSSSLTVRWTPSTDVDGVVAHYRVTITGRAPVVVTGTSYTTEISGNVAVSVVAVDDQGLASAESTATYNVPVAVCKPPSAPVVSVGETTANSIQISWTASTDVDNGVAGYSIYRNGGAVPVGQVSGSTRTYTDRGLSSNTEYAYVVAARDERGMEGPKSNPVKATTRREDAGSWRFAVAGSTSLKTLAGKLGLTGSLSLVPDVEAGTVTGDLALAESSGRMVAAGFLPVTARFAFVPSGSATGTVETAEGGGDQLELNAKVRIKVVQAKLFGAIPLVTGTGCQTRQLTDLALTSSGFARRTGGTLAGTYRISDLNGCGALNGLVSPLTAGGGNTISLTLTRQG